MDKIQMVDLQGQYLSVKEEIDQAIQGVLDSSRFIGGGEVNSFAEEMSSYLAVKHCIPCGNGTDALQIALMALDLERGDEVITTPFTFVATVEVICLLGLKPVFVDIDPVTFNMDADRIEAKLTSRTKVILPVHLFGGTCDMTKIMDIAYKNDLFVVEDNAQSIGAVDSDYLSGTTRLGTIGHIGTTSFFPSKNLGAYGDGGAIFTNDDSLKLKIKEITNHGSSVKYYYNRVGVNSRLDSMQAAILRVKLRQLDKYIERRRAAAKVYNELLKDVDGVSCPEITTSHVFHQYTLRISEKRDEVHQALNDAGVPCMIYYPESLHIQKPYAEFAHEQTFEHTDQACQEVLSLPMHTELTEQQQHHIVNKLKEILR